MLTARDIKRLEGVDARLVKVVKRAYELWDDTQGLNGPVRLMVLEGLRTKERQAALYAQGRTMPGMVVTSTLNSKHLTGNAVDLAPVQKGFILWKDVAIFDAMIDCMMKAADECGVTIRSGADWDRDGKRREAKETDSPHFETWP